ncbi:hypothetical protein Ae168Ps1_6335c [Pseudonocardia sp. Ae168_Ps1]|nr:hypothetical protein Ae150APs1_6233 [Pseudonocardia sp. Ae150A_Ps1]OLL70098.1 hypothetical protein Ae168Ps1_6335c [Pseudonocardia sp. Ae168_Ps1]OLL70369.1 hypothetical protein Ae263Ps1_6313c [Pseudonocardia sp. Ae263_Ps1]OLL89150.1 hypothetical protein Ae356Ps1_6178c [Pseudonocardia sp. Ae356_Ps1]
MAYTYPEWVCTDCGTSGVGEIEWQDHSLQTDCQDFEEVS